MSRLPFSWIFLTILTWSSADGRAQTEGFSEEKQSFEVSYRGERSAYRVNAVFLLPGDELKLEVHEASEDRVFRLTIAAGEIQHDSPRRWTWRAPMEKGLYPLQIDAGNPAEAMTLNAFVLVPIDRVENGYLNGYRIGAYPDIPLRDLPIYKPPRGFVEVTPENEDTLVSPHFRLKQFLCKQASGYPKYLVLRERLLLKLELILAEVNRRGYACDTFFVMSGYRTPHYNRAIGNVKYSRHMWGGAADIFIDERPRDGMLDDLNGDGAINYRDAAVLYGIVDGMYGKAHYKPFVGGLGRYKKTAAHGPFIHVDARGFRARWGD